MGHVLLPDFGKFVGGEDVPLPARVLLGIRVVGPSYLRESQTVRGEFHEVPISHHDGEGLARGPNVPSDAVPNGVPLTSGATSRHVDRGYVDVPSRAFQPEDGRSTLDDFYPVPYTAIRVLPETVEKRVIGGDAYSPRVLGFVGPPEAGGGG